jgi:hypothetical protein
MYKQEQKQASKELIALSEGALLSIKEENSEELRSRDFLHRILK